MILIQYGDYFYLYVLMISLIPAIILGILEKPIKYYGAFLSVLMVIAIMGFGKLFPLFLVGQIVLIKAYYAIRKKTDNKYIYFLALFCSMLPLIISKLSGLTQTVNLGFIGLSYLNFKAIQMIIEIYDGAIEEVNILKTLYFFIFFPTLSSGPVDRSRRFNKDLEEKILRKEYINNYLEDGIKHIIRGIVYKFVLADLINSLWMTKIPTDITFVNSINYMYAYSLYLFFDFAGYSAFAVGASYILGIRTPENFNKPFLSKSMKEFWNRWHISLSRWFGDYIYSRFILNSLRKKRFRNRIIASHVGQILTMFIMGCWHGLKWFYIIYGLYQGLALVLTDIYERRSKFYKAHKKEKWFQCVQIVVTFHIACFGLLLFSGYLFNK
ncbi:peptidoglycan O-acetyltransferase [Clostridium saccharobutylicum]|uniref:D-alanyl-lipoteichoic acid biosynthesis protein DltB n=1 Tax=Clostridium saccharobutylicum TaxID=169679 RepID=UPI000983BA2D|nr:D-alanyl-lipoteichoic acid biosynthesis protein DltB [Clostridium saccharobutylicum]AQS12063.1 peptidoglycan O-acetyltransferase [Clostridium saccharobutylicum]MBC2435760.1 D-alanyl-lipoteichoic acid biosynthesis protein DltB [Clostridium saccharobutylicum]NSB87175.1 membrane protein involved in D-alanine export [Clostridium saccharobutylicum]NYC29917.1 membrane protein involved in D-alanine export [Clostridium saccharobutylicum]OOM18594.1 peptidoglycan O-acetyltransferase [Clostridium sacc